MRMQWDKLLSSVRLGQEDRLKDAEAWRSPFQVDHDRIVFSEAFRRLQSKTQVIPLPENAFVHTRLTHSLETACVGRSLGNMAGKFIIEQERELPIFREQKVNPYDLGAIVSAACLAHDIGNPPFGHSGEDAISDHFKSKAGSAYLKGMTDAQKADLQNFEGNAAGFRMLTHTYKEASQLSGGLNLTYATLGTFTKYPKGSMPKREKKRSKASEKKFGYFQSQAGLFRQVAEHTGLSASTEVDQGWRRHPLSFLMEAADDICYHIIDLEDGFKLGLVSYEEFRGLLYPFLQKESAQKRLDEINDRHEQAGYMRAMAINVLIAECVNVFKENYSGIMEGAYDTALTDNIPSCERMEDIKEISINKIYRSQAVVEIEAAGFEVLGGLLATLAPAFVSAKEELSAHQKKLKLLVPAQYWVNDQSNVDDTYLQLLNIAEYIASMTDNYAISLYRKIKGISLPV